MTWVVSKIIGDGKSVETAFTTAAQQYGIPILSEGIAVDPKTGIPMAGFYLMEIPDGEEVKLANEPGCYVLPDKNIDQQKLILQGVTDVSAVVASINDQSNR